MKMLRELMSATFVAAGLALMCGAGLIALSTSAYAARVASPIIIEDPVDGACTGDCSFSNGLCRSVDCGGTGCSCKGGREDCGCKK